MVLDNRKRQILVYSLMVLAVVVDQIIKILVKTNMQLGEAIYVFGDWCQIRFIENNGMAFGMEIFSKIFLTLFRIVAVGALFYYLIKLLREQKQPLGYMLCIAFILAGAMGNLIDCLFYGEIFSSSYGAVADFVSWGDGYSSFMHGRVVDMFYFPLFTWPDWMPIVGGDIFFGPVFNFADACVSCAMIALLIYYRDIILK